MFQILANVPPFSSHLFEIYCDLFEILEDHRVALIEEGDLGQCLCNQIARQRGSRRATGFSDDPNFGDAPAQPDPRPDFFEGKAHEDPATVRAARAKTKNFDFRLFFDREMDAIADLLDRQ